MLKQTVQVFRILARRIVLGLRQSMHRIAQLRLQVVDQRIGEGNDETFDVLGKTKAMHRQRGRT